MQIQSFINGRQNPKADFYFGLVAVNLIALGYLFGFLNPGDIDTDGGIFSAVAYKDLHEGRLYIDAWENKPPGMIYLIELFFSFIPDKVYALYSVSIIGVLAMVNGFYFLFRILLDALSLNILLIMLFVFSTVDAMFIGDGLYTEIFGAAFIIWGLYCYHLFEKSNSSTDAFITAFILGFSFWFKEPFIFIIIPIIGMLILKLKNSKLILKMLCILMIPSIIFLILLSFNRALQGFIDTVRYNFTYVSNENSFSGKLQLESLWQNILEPLLVPVLIVVVMAIRSLFKLETRAILLFNALILMGSMAFIMISPHNFNHYYLPFIIIFFYCLASFLHYEKLYNKSSRILIYILLLYTMKKMDEHQTRNFQLTFNQYKPDRISEILLKENSKTLFIDLVDASEYYIKANKVFPSFLPVPLAVHFNESPTGENNRLRLYQELSSHLPDFLIIGESSSYMYWHIKDPDLYYSNYEKVDSIDTRYHKKVFLWKKKSGK